MPSSIHQHALILLHKEKSKRSCPRATTAKQVSSYACLNLFFVIGQSNFPTPLPPAPIQHALISLSKEDMSKGWSPRVTTPTRVRAYTCTRDLLEPILHFDDALMPSSIHQHAMVLLHKEKSERSCPRATTAMKVSINARLNLFFIISRSKCPTPPSFLVYT